MWTAESTNHKHAPPIAEGKNPLSAGRQKVIRLYQLSVDPPDPKKPHIRFAARNACQTPWWHSTVDETANDG